MTQTHAHRAEGECALLMLVYVCTCVSSLSRRTPRFVRELEWHIAYCGCKCARISSPRPTAADEPKRLSASSCQLPRTALQFPAWQKRMQPCLFHGLQSGKYDASHKDKCALFSTHTPEREKGTKSRPLRTALAPLLNCRVSLD